MDLLAQYNDDDEQQQVETKIIPIQIQTVNTAPEIVTSAEMLNQTTTASLVKKNPTSLVFNPKVSDLYGAVQGADIPVPQNHAVLASGSIVGGKLPGSTITGYIEQFYMNENMFSDTYNQLYPNEKRKNRKRKRATEGETEGFIDFEVDDESAFVEGFGEYAIADDTSGSFKPLPDPSTLPKVKPANSEAKEPKTKKHKKAADETVAGEEVVAPPPPKSNAITSTFHLESKYDYQGRSFVYPPSSIKPLASDVKNHCFLPKKWIHTWSGHTKSITSMQLFPRVGHLLLSGSVDTQIKIWDVFNHRKCIQTYTDHSAAVRGVSFTHDGTHFVSCGFDKTVKLWDTETGKVVSTYHNGKMPICVSAYPEADRGAEFLCGYADKRVLQWDTRTGDVVQTYARHMGGVNTITFTEGNRKFVTSSDDKTLRVWEYGFPIDVKYISEPHMHSMPSIAASRSGKWIAAQSLDNQILIYETGVYKPHKKKKFSGHLIAGYACQVGFSSDTKYIISGDSSGYLWVWDWKSCSNVKKIKCHDGVVIGCQWHPVETSKIVTAGWDGTLKLWD